MMLQTSNQTNGTHWGRTLLLIAVAGSTCCPTRPCFAQAASSLTTTYRGALLTSEQASEERLAKLKADNYSAVAIVLDSSSDAIRQQELQAAERVQKSGLELDYWVEVARCEALADAHPDWMASLQTHDEWRRFFPKTPLPKTNEVVKTYPWVPILSREPFAAQLDRVTQILTNRPIAERIFLNDLQGAPSACGCGNALCRWTSDYGDQRTTVPLGDDAPVLFVNAIKKAAPQTQVIPVWTTECEEHDGHPQGQCAGVGCFKGICWKAYTKQLGPIEQGCPTIGAFVPYKMFQRDLPIYGGEAEWIRHAVESFSTMPPKHGARAIEAKRLITVVQGWNVTSGQISQQIEVAIKARAAGFLVAFAELDQSWRPTVESLESDSN